MDAANAKCPNCMSPIGSHPENGCVLAAMIQVVRERGTRSEEEVLALHASANVSALWDELGPIIDKLEDGEFRDDVDSLDSAPC